MDRIVSYIYKTLACRPQCCRPRQPCVLAICAQLRVTLPDSPCRETSIPAEVLVCPLCSQSVRLEVGEDPNLTWESVPAAWGSTDITELSRRSMLMYFVALPAAASTGHWTRTHVDRVHKPIRKPDQSQEGPSQPLQKGGGCTDPLSPKRCACKSVADKWRCFLPRASRPASIVSPEFRY